MASLKGFYRKAILVQEQERGPGHISTFRDGVCRVLDNCTPKELDLGTTEHMVTQNIICKAAQFIRLNTGFKLRICIQDRVPAPPTTSSWISKSEPRSSYIAFSGSNATNQLRRYAIKSKSQIDPSYNPFKGLGLGMRHPPCTAGSAIDSVVLAASSRCLASVEGESKFWLMTPTMPFWQCLPFV